MMFACNSIDQIAIGWYIDKCQTQAQMHFGKLMGKGGTSLEKQILKT
jgi:hypothetical protein